MAEIFDFGLQQHKIKMDGKFFESNLFAVAGDTGRRLEVQLLDSDNLVQNTTGISLRLNANVAGQATYAQATLVDAAKGLYELDLPNGMLIAPGNWQFQWQIIDANDKKLHSFAFTGSVGSNLSEGGSEATNFYLNADELKQMQDDLINGTFNSAILETNIAEKLNNLETQYAPKLTEVTAQLAQTEQSLPPKRYIFGKQLENLKTALSNPLTQITEIEIASDSIGWGLGATGNPIDYETGRNGTFTDIRDNYESKSFVNEFKRYIGSKYFSGATPILSNWITSPKGQSIVEFKKDVILFPYGGDFTIENNLVALHEIRQLAGTLTGWEINTTWAAETDASTSISFPFTGEEFTLSFQVTANSIKYELFVDEVSQGVFSTEDGVDGLSIGLDRRRKHVFPFVKNKIVKIKSVKNDKTGYQALKIGGIIVPKKVKISNQGIIGSTARTWVDRDLTSGIVSRGGFLFVQLGANDRATLVTKPKGVNTFMDDLSKLLDKVKTDRNVILMCSNPVASENPAVFNFNMQDVRNTVFRLAKKENMDFIDNYSIFGTMLIGLYTKDGLHLNDYGNELVKRNIINSMEFN